MKRIAPVVLALVATTAFADYPIPLERFAPTDAQPSDVLALDEGRAHVVLDRNAMEYRSASTAYSFAVDFANPSPVSLGKAFLNPGFYWASTTAFSVAGGSVWLYSLNTMIDFTVPPPTIPFGVLGLNTDATAHLRQRVSILRSGKLIQIGGAVFEAQPSRLKPLNGAPVDLALCDNVNCSVIDFLGTHQAGYALRKQRLAAGDMRLDLLRFNANAEVTQVLPLLSAVNISGKLYGKDQQLQLLLSTTENQLTQTYLITVDEGPQALISAASAIAQLPQQQYVAVRNRDWMQVRASADETNYTLLRANAASDLSSLNAPQAKFSVNLPNTYTFAAVEGSALGDIVLKRTQVTASRAHFQHHWLRDDGTQIANDTNWQAVDFTGTGNLLIAERTFLAGQQRTQLKILARNGQTLQAPQLLADVPMTAETVQLIKNASEELISFQTFPSSGLDGRTIALAKHSVDGNSTALAEIAPRMQLAHSLRLGLTHAFMERMEGTTAEIQRVNLQNGQLDAPVSAGSNVRRILRVVPYGAQAIVAVETDASTVLLYRFDGQMLLPILLPGGFFPVLTLAATPEHASDVARFIASSGSTNRVFGLSASGALRTVFDLLPDTTALEILNNGAVTVLASSGQYLLNPDGVRIDPPQYASFSVSDRHGGYWGKVWTGNRENIVHTRSIDARTSICTPEYTSGGQITDSDILIDGDLAVLDQFQEQVHRFRVYDNGVVLHRTMPFVAVATLGVNTIAQLSYDAIPSDGGQVRDRVSIQPYALPVMPSRADYLFSDGIE
jgi:hypothetical protein